MTLLVQKYLKTHSLADLEREHGVEASIFDYKFSLNYSQITSLSTDKLANQCRGLILRTQDGRKPSLDEIVGETKILACPMFRFFNLGDGACANIDWKSAKILTKEDGSLNIVYYDDIKEGWCVATRSVPEANIPMGYKDYTFRKLFERAVNETYGFAFENFLSYLDDRKTYCFELTTPLNRIVVKYDDFRIRCLAIRDNDTLLEECPSTHPFLHSVREFSFSTMNDMLDYLEKISPTEMEGFVVRDKNFNRIKVKSLAYVATHRMKDNVTASDRNIVSLILEEKVDDALGFLPEDVQEHIKDIQSKVAKLIEKHDMLYVAWASEVDEPKQFADIVSRTAATQKIWTAPLFSIYRNKAKNTLDFIKNKKRNGVYPKNLLDTILEQIEEL